MRADAVIGYIAARLRQRNDEEVFRAYVAAALQLLSQGKALGVSYTDLYKPQASDARTGDEIAESVISAAGLVVVQDAAARAAD